MKKWLKRLTPIFISFIIAILVFTGQAHAAPVFHSGFETGDFAEWDSIVGAVSVVEAGGWGSPKTGTYVFRCNPTIGNAKIGIDSGEDTNRFSFNLYITTLPDNDFDLVGNTAFTTLVLTTTGEIDLYDSVSDKLADGTTQLNTDQWYRISGTIDDGNKRAYVWIDGNLEHNGVSVAAADNHWSVASMDLGVLNLNKTTDIYIDDFAEDAAIGSTSDLGDIRVARASPNLAGTYSQYDSVSGFGNVDEIPASDADYIEDNGSDAARESYNIPNLADLDGASSGDTVNAVSVWTRGDRDGGGATDHMIMVRDNGNDHNSATLAFNGISWFNKYYAVMPDDSAAWSEARFNALEIGMYHSGGQDQRCHCLVAMVAYTPATGCSEDISNTPATWSVNSGTAVAVNTTYWSSGSAPSWPLDDTECHFTVTNSSGGAVDITIVAGNFTGGNGWTLSGSNGSDTVVLKAGESGDANEGAMVTLTTSPQSFISALADSGTKKWELMMLTPISNSDGVAKVSVVTISATCT